jgi:hypothetical protein
VLLKLVGSTNTALLSEHRLWPPSRMPPEQLPLLPPMIVWRTVGGGVLIFGSILVFTGRFFIIWLPLSGIATLWGGIKFLTASGCEVEADLD